jgi:hypothetical protein
MAIKPQDLPDTDGVTPHGKGLCTTPSGTLFWDNGNIVSTNTVIYPNLAALRADVAAGKYTAGTTFIVGSSRYSYNGLNLKKLGKANGFQPIANTAFQGGFGFNSAFSITGSSASAPVPWSGLAGWAITGSSAVTQDILLPANVGDFVEYFLTALIGTSATSGIILSVWSINGSQYREWFTGTIGSSVTAIPAASAFFTQAANIVPQNASTAKCGNKVIASDLDSNGFIRLRLYAANSNASSSTYSHYLYGYAASGTIGCYAINWREGKPQELTEVIAYPGYTPGANATINTAGTQQATLNPILDAATGANKFALKIKANPLDYIKVECQLFIPITANVCRPDFSLWSIGGSLPREWSTGVTNYTQGATYKCIGQSNGNPTTISISVMQRVMDTDIDANGYVTLQMMTTDYNSSGSGSTYTRVLNGTDSATGRLSYMRAQVIPSEHKLLLSAPGGAWNNAAPQEPSIFYWNNQWNMLFTMTYNSSAGTWWATCPTMTGTYTIQGTAALLPYFENNVYIENNTLYVYYRNAGGVIGVRSTAGSVASIAQAAETVALNSAAFNSAIVKGPGGTYYMFADTYTMPGYGAPWAMGVWCSNSPTGPFTALSNPVNGLDFSAAYVCSAGWAEWTGEYFRLLTHLSPVANTVSPTYIYEALSSDGINWKYPNIGLDGYPCPLIKNPQEFSGWNQAADPVAIRVEDDLYIFYDLNQGTNPALIVCNVLESVSITN